MVLRYMFFFVFVHIYVLVPIVSLFCMYLEQNRCLQIGSKFARVLSAADLDSLRRKVNTIH